MNNADFTGRTALVTGGTQGIGRAVVERLQRAGATVYIWGLDPKRLSLTISELNYSALGGRIQQMFGNLVDVREPVAVKHGVELVLKHAGHIDVLINNAGAFGPIGSALTYSLADWEEVLRVNLTSQFLVCREVIPHMVKRGYGRVVNMASVVGRDANPLAPAYSAAKAGVIRFTQALGRELAQTGVLVNCVAPSATRTAFFNNVPPAQVEAMLAKVPMGRLGTVSDVAELVCWLASERCSYSTGAVFDCSGGRHE